MQQPKWNQFEAAILLEGYLEAQNKVFPRLQIIKRVSSDLRIMAISNGLAIDEIYRNENGISYQMSSMESAFLGHTKYVPATQLFVDIVRMYRNENSQYLSILETAKKMISSPQIAIGNKFVKDTRSAFSAWLKSQQKLKHPEALILSVQNECSEYADKHNVCKGGFWNIIEPSMFSSATKKLLGMRLFRITHRKAAQTFDKTQGYYYSFLQEYSALNDVESSKSTPVNTSIVELSAESENHNIASIDNAVQIGTDEYLTRFSNWLLNEKHMAERSSNSYASSLRSISHYCVQTGLLPADFICEENSELLSHIKTIFSDSNFLTYNAQQHNRFSAAIKKYAEFRLGRDCPELPKGHSANNVPEQKSPKAKNALQQATYPYSSSILSLLQNRYLYGYRIESAIELNKFKKYAETDGVELPDTDEEIKATIISVGLLIDGKVYVISNENIEKLAKIIASIFDTRCEIAYYDSIFESQYKFMEEAHITSPEMLKEILERNQNTIFAGEDNIYFSKNYISTLGKMPEREAITKELGRVWGESATCTIDLLNDRLPYVPKDSIRIYISGNRSFVWVSEGEYFYLARFIISADEENAIRSFVSEQCANIGFASIADVPIGNIAIENFDLPQRGIYDAIYNSVLSSDYVLNGTILTKGNTELDATEIVKQNLADKEQYTFTEAHKQIIELTGSSHRYMAYEALYSKMIRIDKENYVANQFVKFDVDAIDAVLSSVIKDRFISIKEITSFALFPICGQPWNHYLLESYCYRFSKKYTLQLLSFNDKNAGIIIEKGIDESYEDLLATAVLRAKVKLDTVIVGNYLYNTGYIGRQQTQLIERVIERANAIRED